MRTLFAIDSAGSRTWYENLRANTSEKKLEWPIYREQTKPTQLLNYTVLMINKEQEPLQAKVSFATVDLSYTLKMQYFATLMINNCYYFISLCNLYSFHWSLWTRCCNFIVIYLVNSNSNSKAGWTAKVDNSTGEFVYRSKSSWIIPKSSTSKIHHYIKRGKLKKINFLKRRVSIA